VRTERLQAGGLLRGAVVTLLLLVDAVLIAALLRPDLVPWDVATGSAPAAATEAPAPAGYRGAALPPAGRTLT
jgi:hypothetical protein